MFGGGGPVPPHRFGSILVGGVMAVAAVICFFLPFGWVFGTPLLLLAIAYIYCVGTGMDPRADARTTLGHLQIAASTIAGAVPRQSERTGQPEAPPTAPGQPAMFTPTAHSPVDRPAPPAAEPDQAAEQTRDDVAVPPATLPAERPPIEPTTPQQPTPAPPWASTDGPSALAPYARQEQRAESVPPWVGDGLQGDVFAPGTAPYQPYGPPPGEIPPRRIGRSVMWGLVAAAVVVVLAVATVTVVVATQDDGENQPANALPDIALQSAYPEAPTRAFQISGDDVNASGVFRRPNFPVGGEESTGHLRSDKYAITGIPGGLIAIDPATGEVAWIQDTLGGIGCSDVFDDQTLACITEGGLVLLSAETGKVDRWLPKSGYTRMAKFGDKYAYARSDGSTATVSLGTLDDPEAYWSREESIDGGTRTSLSVSDSIIMWSDGSATGGWTLAYNESGESLNPVTNSYGNLVDNYSVAADNSAKVYNSAGELQYEAGWFVGQPTLYAPAPGVNLAFTGGDVINPHNGRHAWDFPAGLPPTDGLYADVRGVVGSVALANTWPRGGLLAADARTGALLWRVDSGVPSTQLVTDGQRVISIDEYGTVTAYDLASGGVAWTVEAGDLGDYPKLFAVGDHLIAYGSDAMVGFTGSNSPAVLYDSATISTETAGSQSGAAVTRCGSAPKVVPETFRASDGALVVRLKFTATCPGGDIISNSGYRVTIRDQSSLIASAQFNLGGSSVLALPRDGGSVARDFSFPPGTFWRLPSSLSGGGGSNTSVGGSDQTIECTAQGTDTVPQGEEMTPSTSETSSPLTGSQPSAGGATVNPTQNALDALRAQTNADYPLVQRDLAERWLAQISAKQVRTPPLMAVDIDDRTMVAWTPEEILRQHLELRSQYPEVRLVYSNDWSTFDLRDWWITVAQPNVADPVSANAWCDSKALAPNQCFAKLISNTRGSAGTTVYRR